jgi:hypothetical protein
MSLSTALPKPWIDTRTGHADTRHACTASTIRERLERYGALSTWENCATGRRARVCQVARETFGIQIIMRDVRGDWVEITAFTKSKMTRIEQVNQYLRNGGYTPLREGMQ